MAIKINGKPQNPLPQPKSGGGSSSTSVVITKTEQKKAERRKEANERFWRGRAETEQDLRDSLKSMHIPETVEQAIERGGISAQEVIECIEEQHGCKLGPRERRFVVANFIAKDRAARRYEGSNRYCPEVADLILERIMEGESLQSICNRDKYMPSAPNFLRWVLENDDLMKQYTLAQEVRAEVWAARVESEAMKTRPFPIITLKGDGTVDTMIVDNIQRSKLITDTGKWFTSKLKPKKYGQMADHIPAGGGSGGDGQAFTGNDNRLVVEGGLPDWRHQKENQEIARAEHEKMLAERDGEQTPVDESNQSGSQHVDTNVAGSQEQQPGPVADNVGEDKNIGEGGDGN